MTYYPIIIPTLNRYSHFRACIESLARCTYASETELIIGLDFPPNNKYIEGWKKIKDFIPKIQGFKKVICFERRENFGSAKNSSALQNYALTKYDAYIYTEDDNIFSPNFLDFINKGLEKYKDNPNVVAVCGYSYPIYWESSYKSILQHQYFSAWGYGEWGYKLKKMKYEFTPKYLAEYLKNKNNRRKIKELSNKNYRYASSFLYLDSIPIYDISRSVYLCISKKNVLMPTESLVRNTGFDGSGEHCSFETGYVFVNQKISGEKEFDVANTSEVVSQALERFNQKLGNDFKLLRFSAQLKYFLLDMFGYKAAVCIFTKLNQVKRFFKKIIFM